MKGRMHNLAARFLALAASVILVSGCVLTAGSAVKAAVADPYTDMDFEAYLTQQGFPESYKTELRKLHDRYPYWQFEAQHTNLDWGEAVMAEGKVGLNLVQDFQPASWKSTQDGAYDWDAGKWTVFDSGGWVSASEEIISYYMDPRGFLDEQYIFQFLRHSYDGELQTEEGLASMVEGTFLSGTYEEEGEQVSYVDTLMKAAAASGVSPYTLASMIIAEQGSRGKGGGIAGDVEGYEGYYNYFSVGAYKTEDMSAVQRGLWWARGGDNSGDSYGRPWDTRTKSIIGGAEHYGSGYVAKGQDTLYLKKFNVQGDNLYNHQYMGNVGGAALEASSMSDAYTGPARSFSLTFKIPVYLNMPDSACEKPTGNDDPVKENEDADTEAGLGPEDGQDPGEGTPEPKDPDGDITLDDVSGQVGDTVTLSTTVTTPSDVIAGGKIILSYNKDALRLIEGENVSGGGGGAVVSQTNVQREGTVSIPVNFEILAEGIHNIAVESYEAVTESEEILTLTKGKGTVEGTPARAPDLEESEPAVPERPGGAQPEETAQPVSILQKPAGTQDVHGTTGGAKEEQAAPFAPTARRPGGSQAEAVENKPEVTVTERKTDKNKDVENKKPKNNKNIDASKYDHEEREEAASVSAVDINLLKRLGIVMACIAFAGIGGGGVYFLKEIIRNRE